MYPENWPRCPSCGDYAMDGHITCGKAQCQEGARRDIPDEGERRVWNTDQMREQLGD